MNTFSHVPPGFRFHPTDEELVDYYLRKKIAFKRIDLDVIKEVDLYKVEPWDLQELCKISNDEQSDWYFFSHKDKKYPTGTRTNRATKVGFWKATGRDKAIYSENILIGMRKTLVFYKGRAPNGQKSDWIMHEYRLETNENGTPQHQEEGWAVCRVFKKRITTTTREREHDQMCLYHDQVSFMPDFDSPRRISQPYPSYSPQYCKQELDHLQKYNMMPHHQDALLQLPQLESSKIPQSSPSLCSNLTVPYGNILQSSHLHQVNQEQMNSLFDHNNNNEQQGVEQVTDWRVLDKFVASQLSHEDPNKEAYSGSPSIHVSDQQMNIMVNEQNRQEVNSYLASITTPSSEIDLWK